MLVDLLRDIELIKNDIAKLRGQYEVLSYELEQAQKRGMKVGDVSTAEITDATPAVLASHISLRGCQGPADTSTLCPTETKNAQISACQNDVAAVFRSTAEGETGHAHGHLEYLETVGDPATGLPIGIQIGARPANEHVVLQLRGRGLVLLNRRQTDVARGLIRGRETDARRARAQRASRAHRVASACGDFSNVTRGILTTQ